MYKKIKKLWNNFRYFYRKGERLHYFRYRFKHYIYDPKNKITIHTLDAGYHDTDERLLHGMFALLVDFVEVETAWKNFYNAKDKISRWDYIKANWFGIIRSPLLGLEHLDWEMDLVNNPEIPLEEREWNRSQSDAALEVLELYKWWTQIRPNRPEPDDVTGLTDFYDKNRDRIMLFRKSVHHPDCSESYNTLTKEEDELYHSLIMKTFELEEHYAQEDIDMTVRMCKIRRCLWT